MIEVACLLLTFDVVFIWYGCCLAGGDQLADSSSWVALNETDLCEAVILTLGVPLFLLVSLACFYSGTI